MGNRVVRLAVAVVLLTAAGAAPLRGVTTETGISSGMEHVARLEIPGAMAIAFSSRKPEAYVSTRGNDEAALVVVDISHPDDPRVVATLPLGDVGQEDMNLAERADGTAFVLLGPPGRRNDGQHGLTVVDVSNVTATYPPAVTVLGGMPQGSHTWTCLGTECNYAYGTVGVRPDGQGDRTSFVVVDLTDTREPKVVASPPSLASGTAQTHDWNLDDAGVAWAVGNGGIAAYDVGDPAKPQPLNTSDQNGRFLASEFNDRLQLHGSLRPNARRFRSADPIASVHNGNVLLAGEEGNVHDCSDSFQTWYVPHLDGALLPKPVQPNRGTITPLDSWSLLADTVPGVERPLDPDLCSVHWFDYHQDGFVVMATYGSGTRLLDVSDPRDITEVAYHFTAASAASHSYWVPERDAAGRVTGRATNLVYTADMGSNHLTGVGEIAVAGGIDIFRATLPDRRAP